MYYHVSLGVDELVKHFVPRVPHNTIDFEDNQIPRICFSNSIDNCLLAIGNIEEQLEQYNYPIITVYQLEDTSVKMWDNSIVTNFVGDAYLTQEVWVMEPVTLNATYYYIESLEEVTVLLVDEFYRDYVISGLENMGIKGDWQNFSTFEIVNFQCGVEDLSDYLPELLNCNYGVIYKSELREVNPFEYNV